MDILSLWGPAGSVGGSTRILVLSLASSPVLDDTRQRVCRLEGCFGWAGDVPEAGGRVPMGCGLYCCCSTPQSCRPHPGTSEMRTGLHGGLTGDQGVFPASYINGPRMSGQENHGPLNQLWAQERDFSSGIGCFRWPFLRKQMALSNCSLGSGRVSCGWQSGVTTELWLTSP